MLLTGSPPFANSSHPTPISRLVARKTESAPDIRGIRPEIPSALAEVVRRALAQSPGDRYQTPDALREVLGRFTKGAHLVRLVEQGQAVQTHPIIPPLQDTGAHLSSFAVSTSVSLLGPIESRDSVTSEFLNEGRRTLPRTLSCWHGRVFAAFIGLGILGLGWFLFTVFTIDTGWGKLRIESLSEDVNVQVLQHGKVVELVDSKTGSVVRLKPGGYDVALKGNTSKVRLDQSHVELTRDNETVIRVTTLEERPSSDHPSLPPSASSRHHDRIAATWILGSGGTFVARNEGKDQTVMSPPVPDGDFRIVGVTFPETTRILDDELVNLQGLNDLEKISLEGIPVTGVGFQWLRDSKNLWSIGMHNTKLSDAGLQAISNFSSIAILARQQHSDY